MIKKLIFVFMYSTLYSCPILMTLEFSWQIFEKSSEIKFHENPLVRAELFHAGGRTDMTKLTVAFRNFANESMETRGNITTVGRNRISNWARKTFKSSGLFTLTTLEVVNNAANFFPNVSPNQFVTFIKIEEVSLHFSVNTHLYEIIYPLVSSRCVTLSLILKEEHPSAVLVLKFYNACIKQCLKSFQSLNVSRIWV
jgi:hypothetical protein